MLQLLLFVRLSRRSSPSPTVFCQGCQGHLPLPIDAVIRIRDMSLDFKKVALFRFDVNVSFRAHRCMFRAGDLEQAIGNLVQEVSILPQVWGMPITRPWLTALMIFTGHDESETSR